MQDLVCPKCGGAMRSYERNSVTIEQCTDCRGVFLDRGELDRMIDLESQTQTRAGAGVMQGGGRDVYEDRSRRDDGYRDDRYRDDDRYRHHKKKRGGFLGELFDD